MTDGKFIDLGGPLAIRRLCADPDRPSCHWGGCILPLPAAAIPARGGCRLLQVTDRKQG